jgi:predicted nuclease of restriction endonuclease-like RecB superfamily
LLTSDLIRVRRKKELIVPVYLRGPAVERLAPILRYYLDTLSAMVGRTRDEIDAALDAAHVPARDRVTALGIRKVLEDRAEFEVAEGSSPEELRREVFAAAAVEHRELDVRSEFDRDRVIAAVAARLGETPASIEGGLYADLHGSELLKRFTPLAPEEVILRYNLGLAQAILLRATRVLIHIEGEEPARYRQIFRAARFHGLLHVVRGNPEVGYTIELDGPYSLFDAVQRYGLKLALFLPSVLSCEAFRLKADVLWGRERAPAVFELSAADELVSPGPEAAPVSPDLEVFCDAFQRLSSAWSVAKNERIFALPGEVVCVPDLVFSSRETGEEVFLEAFGFWSRAAVWQRVELIRKGFPARILLVVSKQLRVSEEVLGEEDAGEIYVYRRTISPREVLERLERGRAQGAGDPGTA